MTPENIINFDSFSILIILLFLTSVLCFFLSRKNHLLKKDLDNLKEKFKNFSEPASDCVWEMDENFRFTSLSSISINNNSTSSLVSTSHVIGKTRWENAGVFNPKNDPKWERHYNDLIAHKPFRDFVYMYRRDDLGGKLVVSRTSGKPVYDKHGNFKGYIGTATDITKTIEIKNLKEEASKRLLQDLDTLSEGFSLWDSELNLKSWNEQFHKILESLSIKPDTNLNLATFAYHIKESEIIEDIHSSEIDDFFRQIQFKKSKQSSLVLELTTGKRFLVREGKNSLNEHIITVTDISILKDKEKELLHLQKMEILGQITGGVAHDFNNLLAVISGNLELLKKHYVSEKTEKFIKNAFHAAENAANLTERLLAFARRQNLKPKIVSIYDSLESIYDLIKSSLGGSITFNTNIEDNLFDIFVDITQLETAILNLAINSKDAMPDGGEFNIRISKKTIIDEDELKSLKLKRTGEYLVITCSDTGFGMNKETLKRVTEPFFTTKSNGKGSGLGLSMVYGFVRQSGGAFKINSVVNQGTEISIYFPKSQTQNKLIKNITESNTSLKKAKSKEVILIVEDNKHILDLVTNILTNLEYTILKAKNCKEAMQILETEDRIDLLLSDVILPGGMNGFEIAKYALNLRRKLPILFMTGYSPVDPQKYFTKTVPILNKPFTELDLSDSVYKAIYLNDDYVNLENVNNIVNY